MVNFIAVDLTLLALFIISISVFLYKKRKSLVQEGWLVLYKTKWGVKLIDTIGKKYKKTLKVFSYIAIGLAYVLMLGIFMMLIQSVYLYFTSPLVKTITGPPIAPLIPYFPTLFGYENFFPPFYFVYFIITILIVITVHEFSHGIFARRYKIKIKSTGFAFLKYFPAIFGAFVEQDERQMNKKKNIEQMAVLSTGAFANIIAAIVFYIILFYFFTSAYTASGVIFDTYSYVAVNVSAISSINGVSVTNYGDLLNYSFENESKLNTIAISGVNYIATKSMLEQQANNTGIIILYYDSPAIDSAIGNTINEIDGIKINSIEKLSQELSKYPPGTKIELKTTESDGEKYYNITLGENPENKSKAWLGIGFYNENSENLNLLGKILLLFPSYKESHVYYTPKNEFVSFIKDLLWWVVIINLLVGLFNMLPLGILDGGRFFYLTVLSITKSEKSAKKSFSLITYFIAALFLLLIIRWIFLKIL